MHKYTSNKSHRKEVIVVTTILSLISNFALTPLCDFLLTKLKENLEPIFIPFILLIGFGFSTIFGIFYLVFDKWLWQIIPGIKSQKISGTYICEGHSNYKIPEWKGVITVQQTWSKILISLKTDNSYSRSYMANIDVLDDGKIVLYYCYRNDPNGKIKALHKHEGTSAITFDGTSINGKYYNYPNDRQRYGTFVLNKQEKKIK